MDHDSVDRLAMKVGLGIHDERRRRRMTIRELADRADVSVGTVHGVESGGRASLAMYQRLAKALGRELDLTLVDPAHRGAPREDVDLVHAAMGELEVRALEAHGFRVAVDEPWQHYHFAGRADVLAWDVPSEALAHFENRTRLPDFQDALGRFNTKRRFLAQALWRSLGFRRPPRFETHAMVALWSTEVLRVLRQRPASLRAAFPDPTDALTAWLSGTPALSGSTTFALLDPFATGRQRRFLGLEPAIDSARARIHGYAEAAELLRRRR